MNLKTHIESARKHQTYNTPSISTLFFFQQQLDAMNLKGYAGVVEEGRRRAKLFYDWAEEKDYLAAYVKDKNLRSTAVATIDVDEKIDVASLVSRLEKLRLVYGIDSYRKLSRNQFRVALFHHIDFEDLERLTELLSHAIETHARKA